MSDLRVHLLVDYQLYSFVDLSEPHGTFVQNTWRWDCFQQVKESGVIVHSKVHEMNE